MKDSAIMYSIYDTLILLVDNDLKCLDQVSTLLSEAGFQHIITAETCAKALTICKSIDKPYLIITEFQLKAMSGPELIKAIKAHCDDIKFIVLSGSDHLADSFKSLEVGALSFVHKQDKNWERVILDVVRTWIEYYKKRENRRIDFRQKMDNLKVASQ